MINLTQSVQKIALNVLWIDEVCSTEFQVQVFAATLLLPPNYSTLNTLPGTFNPKPVLSDLKSFPVILNFHGQGMGNRVKHLLAETAGVTLFIAHRKHIGKIKGE